MLKFCQYWTKCNETSERLDGMKHRLTYTNSCSDWVNFGRIDWYNTEFNTLVVFPKLLSFEIDYLSQQNLKRPFLTIPFQFSVLKKCLFHMHIHEYNYLFIYLFQWVIASKKWAQLKGYQGTRPK